MTVTIFRISPGPKPEKHLLKITRPFSYAEQYNLEKQRTFAARRESITIFLCTSIKKKKPQRVNTPLSSSVSDLFRRGPSLLVRGFSELPSV